MNSQSVRWQARMAPFMAAAVLLTALFFAIVTIWKFGLVEERLNRPAMEPAAVVWIGENAPQGFDEQMQLASAQATYNLERELIARRYDQGNLAFATRLWTRFMGFITGMILALVGAAFVLGKLDADTSELAAAASGVSLTLRSASPGVLLAALGTILMAISITLPVTVSTKDGAIYFRPTASSPADDPPVSSAAPSEDEPQLKSPKQTQ